MKRWIGLALILVPFFASAEAFWDGNAALQRGDAAFEGGMFAASNSFAPDTQILVQNLETGKAATVTITGRVDGQADILVLLSPAAASALGISAGTLASVRVTVPPRAGSTASSVPAEQALSSDPDLNPGAAYGGAASAASAQVAAAPQAAPDQAATAAAAAPIEPSPSLETLPGTTTPPLAQAPAEVPQSTPEAPAAQGTPAAAQAPTAAASEAAEDAAILAEVASRTPQKDVFLPPREDKTFAYQPPLQPVQAAVATPPVETPAQAAPAEPQITAVIGEPEAAPAPAAQPDVHLAEATAPQESSAQEIVGADATPPAQQSAGSEIALAPPDVAAEEAPPQAAEPVQTEVTGPSVTPPPAPVETAVALAAPEAPAPLQPAQAATTAVASLPPARTQAPQAAPSKAGQNYYVQLAAYSSEKGAQDLAATLSGTYPALVLAPAASGTRMFRVVVGPLNRAESGTLLVWFRFRGFPDAFVKQE